MSGVGFNLACSIGTWETRLDNKVEENRDKEEPMADILELRDVHLSRPPSSMIWITCRKKLVFCYSAAHIPGPRVEKARGGNLTGAIGAKGPGTTHTHKVS